MRSGGTRAQDGRAELRFDVGTLWTLERDTHVARCALVWVPHAWELCVLIDDESLLSERCSTEAEVLAVARIRMVPAGPPASRAAVPLSTAEGTRFTSW